MEREEAIFENENNSNLESESNNRQQLASLSERNLERSEDEENETVGTGDENLLDQAKTSQISISHPPCDSKLSPHTVDSEDITVENRSEDTLSHQRAEEKIFTEKDVAISPSSCNDEQVKMSETPNKTNAGSDRCDLEVMGSEEVEENEKETNVVSKPVNKESLDVDNSGDAANDELINPRDRDKDPESNKDDGEDMIEEEVLEMGDAKILSLGSKRTNEIEAEDSDYDLLPEEVYSKLNSQKKEEIKSNFNGIGDGTSFCDNLNTSPGREVSKDANDPEKNICKEISDQDLTSPQSIEKEEAGEKSETSCLEVSKSPNIATEGNDAEMIQESSEDDSILEASSDSRNKGDSEQKEGEQKESPPMEPATAGKGAEEEDELDNFGSKNEGLCDQPATKGNEVDASSGNQQSPELDVKIPSYQTDHPMDDDEGEQERTRRTEMLTDVGERDENTEKLEEIHQNESILDDEEQAEKLEEVHGKEQSTDDVEQGEEMKSSEEISQKESNIDTDGQGESTEKLGEIHQDENAMDLDEQSTITTKAAEVEMIDEEENAEDTKKAENFTSHKVSGEGDDGKVFNSEETSMELAEELAPEKELGLKDPPCLMDKQETIGEYEKAIPTDDKNKEDAEGNAVKKFADDQLQNPEGGEEDVICLTKKESDMEVDEPALLEDSHKDDPLTHKATSEVVVKEGNHCKSNESEGNGVVIINLDKDCGSSEDQKNKTVEVSEDSKPLILDQPSQETVSVDLTSFTPLKALNADEDSSETQSLRSSVDEKSNSNENSEVPKPQDSTSESMELTTSETDGNKSDVPLSSQATVTETIETAKEKESSVPRDAQTPDANSMTKEKGLPNEDNDVIMMLEIKKETDSDYKVQVPVMGDVKPEAVDVTKLKSEVIVVDDEQEAAASKKAQGEDADASESNLGIQIAAVSGQQHQLHANACDGSILPTDSAGATSAENEKTNNKSQTKSKVQTCIVCQTVTRCKYNIVRNGDTKQLCGDICFKKFRSNPNRYLQKEKTPQSLKLPVSKSTSQSQPTKVPKTSSASASSSSSTGPAASSNASQGTAQYKTCHVCQVMNINAPHKFCNWKGLDFCGESCLAKFQATLNNTCSHCNAYIPIDMRASFCLKIGNDMRPFCKQKCYQEFKKNLRMCAYCQKDLLSFATVTAKVGMDNKPKEFCSWSCVKKLEGECDDVQIVSVQMGKSTENGTCSVCKVQGRAVKHSVRFQSKTFNLCSDICLSAFQYTNKINVNKCDSCGMICTSIEAQVHFIQFEGSTKRFCSDPCVNNFRLANRKVVECTWCGAKKTNFDMIERLDEENKFQLFCSLNCLSLYRVNLQAKSNMAVQCDQCKKVVPAQYHLTMSDASVRNFCSYGCVMTFQSQFTQKALPHRKPQQQIQSPTPQQTSSSSHSHGTRSRGRSKTWVPPVPAAQPSASTVPIISDVVSLASDGAPPPDKTPTPSFQANSSTAASIVQTLQKKGSLFTGDGKERIVIRAPSPTVCKNKSVQSRPFTQTKATSCRPHSQSKEVQTEEDLLKPVFVPVPVPIYIPTPSVMFTAPAPVPLPIPIPIPIPVFVPTTRKSANGIMKAIKEIVERMPSDPLEAEMLMMAEAVAADGKRSGDSDTDSEQDMGGDDYGSADIASLPTRGAKGNDSSLSRKREGAGEEDMIQMALRMAEEMSGPIEDLETSVEPSVVKMEPSRQPELEVPTYEKQTDPDYSPSPRGGRGRGTKRQGRGRSQSVNTRSKRQKTGHSSYAEPDVDNSPSIPPQLSEPPPDHNRRLKFTFGVNAWKNWVGGKNAEIERLRLAGTSRMRCLPTDILKCTMDELNYSLCLFIKEVRKPNGELYSPDSIYYLCLGIQQYMYENCRIDNIFTDLYFQRFTDALHELLKSLQPKVNSQGQMLCRIEEEHLWESKQLGAHSPYILLNTLIYFHTKHFILKTASEHMSLSFAQILKHLKRGVPVKSGSGTTSKNVSLRFYCLANKKDPSLASRKNKDGVPVFEVTENFVNPLRCPVKLYEFFLSKCPESIKNRNDIFYPVPERSCVPDSPVWYSTQSIDINTMDKMLTRILLVREIQEAHLHAQAIYI